MDRRWMIKLVKYNEAYIHISSEPAIEQELVDYFTFSVPGYKYMPSYRSGFWDGKVRLYNSRTKLLYFGLYEKVLEFAKQREYEVKHDNCFAQNPFSLAEAIEFCKTLNLPFEPRDYQLQAFAIGVRNSKRLLLSPTASGKSFIIYLLTRYYNKKTLIIVPTTSLVSQLSSDFSDYGYDSENHIHKITGGIEKNSDRKVTISTWQSIYKLPKSYFSQFDMVIVDEAHLAKATSLTKIMTNLENCQIRFGFTGTLDGTQTNKLVLEGLFGPIHQVTTTSKLIEEKTLADFNIKCIVFNYPDELKKMVKTFNYQEEIEYLITCEQRNKFIKNLAISLKGNTLILFQYVSKHGDVLYDMIKNATDRPVYYVHGDVDGEKRDEIRKIVEGQEDAIIIASNQTFSTGINITSLKNIVFSSPSKSRVRTLQSIGRVLRKTENKTNSVLFDLSDNLQWKSRKNFTLLHFLERLKIYGQEKFPYKIYNVELIK